MTSATASPVPDEVRRVRAGFQHTLEAAGNGDWDLVALQAQRLGEQARALPALLAAAGLDASAAVTVLGEVQGLNDSLLHAVSGRRDEGRVSVRRMRQGERALRQYLVQP